MKDEIKCPGCGVVINFDNAGGYRTFCIKCVDAMPPIPKGYGGFLISGKYPNFKWTK